jgi:hypothetical protein
MTAVGGAMRKVIVLAISVFVPLLGVAGVGYAQSAVEVQGTIEAVDCQALTVVLSAPTGTNTITAADYTAVLVNSTSVPFCTLEAYIGATATAWLVPNGNQFSVTQINVTGPATVAPPTGVTAEVSPVPIWGVVLGTIVVAGLVYLLAHGPDGGYYRYPYYGEYYRHYYHPEYRPYTGYYPASAPVITVAPVISGVVLGIVVIDNLQYILSRDAGGHLYRYPYYGPYRQVYYHPTYRAYRGPYVTTGAYRNAPVRQGEPHWDAPANAIRRIPATKNAPRRPIIQRQPGPQPVPVRPPTPTPAYQLPARQRPPAPAYQPPPPQRPPAPAYQPPPPQRPSAPAYQPPPPQRPPAPAYQPPPPQRPPAPAYQPPPPQRPPAPAYRPPAPRRPAGQQCGGPNQPPCPSGGPQAPGYQPPTPQRPPKR